MSGVSDSKPCPVCGCDMDVYMDWKPFDTVNMNCLCCGFYGYVHCGMQDDEERRANWREQGRDEGEFEPLPVEVKRQYLEHFKALCGAISPAEEARYLGLPEKSKIGNSLRDQVKDLLAELLCKKAGISLSDGMEAATETADELFDLLEISVEEQDQPIERQVSCE